MTKKTKHEKQVELAAANNPSYGIYITGGDLEELAKAVALVAPVVECIITSDSAESTKRAALLLLEKATPSVDRCNISNVNIDMNKPT